MWPAGLVYFHTNTIFLVPSLLVTDPSVLPFCSHVYIVSLSARVLLREPPPLLVKVGVDGTDQQNEQQVLAQISDIGARITESAPLRGFYVPVKQSGH